MRDFTSQETGNHTSKNIEKSKMADNEAFVPGDEILNLSSPPKPTRIIEVERKITPQRNEFVQSTSSLPALAGEVAVAQKNQVLRLEKRVEFLGKLRVLRNIFLDSFIKKFVTTYLVLFLFLQVEHREGRIEKCFFSSGFAVFSNKKVWKNFEKKCIFSLTFEGQSWKTCASNFTEVKLAWRWYPSQSKELWSVKKRYGSFVNFKCKRIHFLARRRNIRLPTSLRIFFWINVQASRDNLV